MRILLLAFLSLTSVQAHFATERRGRYTIYKREDEDFFPFPANQSSIVSEATQPDNLPNQDLTVSDVKAAGEIPRAFIEAKCDFGKKSKIKSAWAEAKKLADAQTQFRLDYRYDIPHSQWLGKDWNSKSSWIPWKYNYRKLIGDNFRRLARLFSNNAPAHEFIYWYCYDYSNQCTPGVQAYAWDSPGFFWSNHYTVFCDPFYGRSSMEELMVKHQDNQQEQKVMENFHISRGQIMFHEIWHYKDLVSSPRTLDYGYQAQGAWDLAKNKGTSWAYVNADSYALDAVAIYVQQYYKSSMSPVPWRELGKLDVKAAAAVAEPVEDIAVAKSFDSKPPGWDGPLVTDDKPDMSVWEEVKLGDLVSPQPTPNPSPPPPPAPTPNPPQAPNPAPPKDENECHGISGDYWVMSRDLAVDNAKDFCGQTDKSREYNGGSVNELRLSVRSLTDASKGPKDAPDCVARFQDAVIDGCDGGNPVDNPHNYKFGATLTTADGWEYKMEPLSKQVNDVSCDVSYKFFFNSFEIRGKNFPPAELGLNGEGLKYDLEMCGALTKWNFEETPDDCCFQWYASGQLPVGTKNCIGIAVRGSGGSDAGNCHLKGRRDANSTSIDSWPGYGDDSKHVFKTSTQAKRDEISAWPGYGDEGKHIFRTGSGHT